MIENRLKEIISDYSGLSVGEIRNNMSLQTDVGLDSFGVISMICDIEESFGIQISDSDMDKLNTLSDLITYIECRTMSKSMAM